MVLPLNVEPDKVLNGLLTNVNAQAQAVGFNIAFNNLQNTVIDRMNKKIAEIADVESNQREMDALGKTFNDLAARRTGIASFAFTNDANREHFSEISTLATGTIFNFSVGDADTQNISADEVAAFTTGRDEIRAFSDKLVELSHIEFVDGNNAIRVRNLVDELFELTPAEGTLDDEGSATVTNDNRAIIEKLGEIALAAGAAADSSLTLRLASSNVLSQIDRKLRETDAEIKTINAERAAEIEFEIQMLRIKNATFLRSIEVAFDTNAQGIQSLSAALAAPSEDPPLGSVLSILT